MQSKIIQKQILISLFLVCICASNCTEKIAINNQKLLVDKPGVELIKNLKVIYSAGGNIRAIIQSPKALNFIEGENPYQEFPQGFDVRFIENVDSTICTLQAKYGLKQTRKRLTEIRDSVVLKSSDGKTMTTEQLFWDEEKHQYHSDKPVKVVTPNEIIHGIGFSAREDFTQYKVLQVTGYKMVESNGETIEIQ